MIPHLPTEIVINVYSNLYIKEIHDTQIICKRWNNFVKSNESPLYRGAAVKHQFVSPNTSWQDVQKLYPGAWLARDKGWKELCQRWFQLERSWEGRDANTPVITMMQCTGTDVHRFKLDEENRLVVTTHKSGGLRVSCMDGDVLLFEMNREYVRRYAHCEYGNGYLIFDRTYPHGLEVWRVKTDDWDGTIPSEPPTRCMPTQSQLFAAENCMRCTEINTAQRGCFLPWAFFLPPHDPRAYRVVYPTLLIGSIEGGELYLYDIPSAALTQTITLPRNESTMFTDEEGNDILVINYVEIGPRHVFVCTASSVVIIARDAQPAGQPTVVDFPRADPTLHHPRVVQTYASRLRYREDTSSKELAMFHLEEPFQPTVSTSLIPLNDTPQEFIGVHVSQCGCHFAAITWYGNMYIVPDFERVLRREASFSDITLRINLEASAMNIAFEYGRVCVQTIKGLYVFNLDTSYHGVVYKPSIYRNPKLFPNLTIHQLEFARNRASLQTVSCLKLTKSAIWLNWSGEALREDRAGRTWREVSNNEIGPARQRFSARTICRVDFASKKAPFDIITNNEQGSVGLSSK